MLFIPIHILYIQLVPIYDMFQLAPILARVAMAGGGLTAKSPLANAVSGASFGAPYAFSTYVGFPGNYQRKTYKRTNSSYIRTKMPYGTRKIRIWSNRYRRYIWVYPRRNRYQSQRYGRKSYGSYNRRY